VAFVIDALEQALHNRRHVSGVSLVHHSDRGVQYVSIKYTERLAEAGLEPSVSSVGDSYDNALAETINGLLQGRSHPPARAMAEHGGRRIRHARMGGLVQ
jgi:transposase InsO family protein